MDFLVNQNGGGYVLSGVAGSGKTTLMAAILHLLSSTFGFRVTCISFTGRAAAVMENKLRQNGVEGVVPRTIHSYLYKSYYDSELRKLIFSRRPIAELRQLTDIIVVDESQMVNQQMFNEIMDIQVPVIFLGDKEQLPPVVSDDNPFNIMEEANFHMTHIQRQAANNPIIGLSKEIREKGIINKNYESSAVHFMNKRDITARTILQLPTPVEVFLTGTNKARLGVNSMVRAANGYQTLHAGVGETIVCLKNGSALDGSYIANGQRFKVMSVSDPMDLELSKNQVVQYRIYQLQNLDGARANVGTESATYMNRPVDSDITVNIPEECWEDENVNPMKYQKRTNLVPCQFFTFGYAMSVWKACGSEFKSVLFFDEDVSYFVDRKKFRYTAVTRAREELIIAV